MQSSGGIRTASATLGRGTSRPASTATQPTRSRTGCPFPTSRPARMKRDNRRPRSVDQEGISLEEAVERVYAEAIRQTARALQADEVGEPYRGLTHALQTAYPDLIAHVESRAPEHAAPASTGD